MQGRRRERASETIRLELTEILEDELDDPRAPAVRVTKVELSKDLANCKVLLCPAQQDKLDDEQAFLEPFQRAGGFIRSQLAARIELRRTPLLEFRLDRGQMNVDRIDTLLERVNGRSR